MTISILILLIFLIAAALMFLRKLPAILALPLMAIAIVAVEIAAGRLTFDDLTRAVMADGAIRLADPIIISMFGGMLSVLMQKTGVAESFVRRGAELSGDNPLVVASVMFAMITLLFTTIGGLGAVIMVGTIVLPILASIGVREYISGGIVLFGISCGGLLNAGNWVVYKTVLGLESSPVSSYAVSMFAVVAAAALLFLTTELWRTRVIRPRPRQIVCGLALLAAAALLAAGVRLLFAGIAPGTLSKAVRWAFAGGGAALLATMLADLFRRGPGAEAPAVKWYAYLIPVVPLLLILVFDMPFVPAFMTGLAYGVLATCRRGMVNMTSRSIIEGSASVVPAIVLMIGIGMLLSAILGPTKTGPGKYWYDARLAAGAALDWPVLTDMKPLLGAIVPGSRAAYVLIFTALAPLALYRGPLNVWGLGYGVGGILLATGVPAGAVMGILMSLGTIQGVSDPTNTANVWVANEVRLDVTTLMWRTLPYAWAAAVAGLIIAAARFF
ncbi:MAG: citrate transporter [Elusimicrobiota bacterium]